MPVPPSIGLPVVPGGGDLRPFLPDLLLIAGIVGVLLTAFFVPKPNRACAGVALGAILLALLAALATLGADAGPHFRGLLVADAFGGMWRLLLLLFVAGVILLWCATAAPSTREGDGPEFFALLLGATLGMSLMGATANLLMLFLTVELASLPSYVLAGFRKTHRLGAEASLKYVLFGAAATSVMAYGLSLLYGLFGTLDLAAVAARLASGDVGSPALLVVAGVGVLAGVGFKIAAVPFHFWCPDVFEGAGIDVTAFLSVASKGAGLAMLVRVLWTLAGAAGYHDSPGLSLTAVAMVVGVLGAVTATVGNTAALSQTNVKRLLAYSSIAHAGYMLCAAALLLRTGRSAPDFDPAAAGPQAILLYLAVYVFMNLGAFTVAAVVARTPGRGERVADYAGLGRQAPLPAACLAVCLVSLVGLPPLGGFVAKLTILWRLFQFGGWGGGLLIAVIAANTVVSAFYYFRVLRAMYLQDSEDSVARDGRLPTLAVGIGVACAAMLVTQFVGWGLLDRLTARNASIYIESPRPWPGERATPPEASVDGQHAQVRPADRLDSN